MGLEDVNKIYVPVFVDFLNELEKDVDDQEKQVEKPDDVAAKDEIKNSKAEGLKEFGRCDRLFTKVVCQKMIEVLNQWSVAGLSLKVKPDKFPFLFYQTTMHVGNLKTLFLGHPHLTKST